MKEVYPQISCKSIVVQKERRFAKHQYLVLMYTLLIQCFSHVLYNDAKRYSPLYLDVPLCSYQYIYLLYL
jgi:hypothetical protein